MPLLMGLFVQVPVNRTMRRPVNWPSRSSSDQTTFEATNSYPCTTTVAPSQTRCDIEVLLVLILAFVDGSLHLGEEPAPVHSHALLARTCDVEAVPSARAGEAQAL